MRLPLSISAALLTTHLFQTPHDFSETETIIKLDEYPETTLDATAWALVYTYPLAIFASWAGGVLRDVPVNKILHQRTLASPMDPGVIKPNIDTLYSRVVIDLSTHDLVLTVPNITDRYYVYPVYDPYGNDIAEIGLVNGNEPGDYLIRRAEDVAVQPGSKGTVTNETKRYRGIVDLPTTYGTMLIRILLLQNTTQDLDIVHSYQNSSLLTEVNRTASTTYSSRPPALNTTGLNGSLLGISTPQQQLQFAARIVDYNQPENYTDRAKVAGILARAGLYNNRYHPQPNANLTQAVAIANASITAFVEQSENIRLQGNSWQLQTPENQGNYGTRYASRAYVALSGYQQLTVRQALYPGYGSLGFTSAFNLQPNISLLVSFSGKPELKRYGFWSLSVYGQDQYLIPNPIDRFSVSDRTYDLGYDDGQPIYGPTANLSRSEPFQILVQSASLKPPANWTSNWLPVSDNFTWILRWYIPQDAMTNGSYEYPVLKNISAIV